MKIMASTEPPGCRIDGDQDAKMETLVKMLPVTHALRTSEHSTQP